MFNMNPPMLCFIIELCLEYCLYNYLKYCIMENLSISTKDIGQSPISLRASNTFNQVVEAKRFEEVFLCRKGC